MKSTFALAATSLASLLLAGCANVAQTSTAEVPRDCSKIALAKTGRIDSSKAPQTDLDRAEARGKLAAMDLNLRPDRSTGGERAIDEALRDCR